MYHSQSVSMFFNKYLLQPLCSIWTNEEIAAQTLEDEGAFNGQLLATRSDPKFIESRSIASNSTKLRTIRNIWQRDEWLDPTRLGNSAIPGQRLEPWGVLVSTAVAPTVSNELIWTNGNKMAVSVDGSDKRRYCVACFLAGLLPINCWFTWTEGYELPLIFSLFFSIVFRSSHPLFLSRALTSFVFSESGADE